MDVVDQTMSLYRLLADSKRRLEFEEAREQLGLSGDEMHLAVELLNEAFDYGFFEEAEV